ncbi:NAD-dependent epimerase/dehydratase family protein [Nitratireductor sp. XY-223]|uniref:NAD-dependent epimerase/dehydratase family protein n=1 Tax=Nitratireductor sp. XY-223 TaxID=2561926 RepID=UPI0019801B9F|nr:NAD-dependent epimerase/dehydratase family protein [Nitratireductor sp. XY-223]
MPKRIFITGTAGFIGYHLARVLLAEGFFVHGIDGLTDDYDLKLKRHRLGLLLRNERFTTDEAMLEDADRVRSAAEWFRPDIIVHLAAQSVARHSLENPRDLLDSNIIGTLNVMEAARTPEVDHLLMASSSSVYGANDDMPLNETEKADTQLTAYAATKKANESMAHAHAHVWGVPTTMLRFFNVYGPLGRPDVVLFKFVDAILSDRPIDVYNNGGIYRDFTYVDDLVRCIRLLMDVVPEGPGNRSGTIEGDSLSAVAPFRIVNIGNTKMVRLLDFVEAIEVCLEKPAQRNLMPMQTGDVPASCADATLLHALTGYRPQTDYREGVGRFVEWYREYYQR